VPVVADRSLAVTCIKTTAGLAPRLREWCEREAGLTLGVGFSLGKGRMLTDGAFRIGHMGHLSPHTLLGTLASIESGLIALGIEDIGSGVEAAVRVIASSDA